MTRCRLRKATTLRSGEILAGSFPRLDMDRPPAEFSGGYQVRLNHARPWLRSPTCWLLDERPTS